MQSKWYDLKPKAIKLRGEGLSLRDIEQQIQVPRSTLSGWLKNIKLTDKQKADLKHKWRNALKKARVGASLWHKAQKEERLETARKEAISTLDRIDTNDRKILELALAMLYLGEGSKKKADTAMGSSDPLILKFFVTLLKRLYGISPEKIKCQLSLRADQNPEKITEFWSKELNLPKSNFYYFNLDKRTIGSKTYPSYKGVCAVRCGNIAIQRKLIFLSNLFCNKII